MEEREREGGSEIVNKKIDKKQTDRERDGTSQDLDLQRLLSSSAVRPSEARMRQCDCQTRTGAVM